MSTEPDQSACRNCGTPVAGPFCYACGQKVAERPASLSGFFREVIEELFEFRSRSLVTFFHLIFRPGRPTASYFDGHKVRYAQPMQVYVVAAALFFLANSFNSFIVLSPQNKVESRIGLMRTGQQLSQERIDSLEGEGLSIGVFRERFRSVVSDTLPPFLLGSVVLFGAVIWLFHPRTPALMHFVFALHWTAFFLIIMAIERTLFPEWEGSQWIRGALNLGAIVHLIVSLKTVYGYGPTRAIVSGLSLGLLFNVILILWVLAAGFFAVNTVS